MYGRTFVSRNFTADAEKDLRNFKSPILLLLGDDDINVDVQETERVYRERIMPSSCCGGYMEQIELFLREI